MKMSMVSLGCDKNTVDSEMMLGLMNEKGFEYTDIDEEAEVMIINTCGFIQSAKEESINMILNLCNQKDAGKLKKVFVMGCLSERYMDELKAEIPQVDKFYGKFNWKDLLKDLQSDYDTQTLGERVLTTPSHYAYIKIAEGCNRMCAYCAIPLITGHHVSRPKEEILDEVRELVTQGVKEFQVIEQELTYYGIDLHNKPMIAELVEEMAKIPGVEWIRLHYAYPNDFPTDLLRVIKENNNVCNYLDIALQHISDNVLQRMRRHVTKQETLNLIKKMREEVPNLCIRTTLLVGFPGETEEDFKELYNFVRDTRFDRMGVFAYSEEEGTFAALHYEDDISEEVKQERVDKLMELQMEISTELNAEKVGKTYKTIVDRQEGEFFIGRTEFDSPEVDCEVLIPVTEGLTIGKFYNVDIVDSDEYDLYGTTLK